MLQASWCATWSTQSSTHFPALTDFTTEKYNDPVTVDLSSKKAHPSEEALVAPYLVLLLGLHRQHHLVYRQKLEGAHGK